MATYSGEEYSLMTCANMSPNCWDGRWEFSLSEISSGRYAYSISIYLRLVPGKRASNNKNTWGDYDTAHYFFYIPEVGVNEVTYGPYRVVGGQGWTKYLATISGEFTVSGKTTIRPGFGVMSGRGNSEGTHLYAVDTWWCGCGEYEVIGIKPAVPSNPRCTAKTSSSITMTFDIDWGNEPENGTRDPACTLLDANHNEIRVIRNGTSTGTFTGLSRYTPYYIRGYACNSQGGGYTNEVLVYTNPENPTISKPVISNLGRLTATVTPGKVTDDGGKAITEIETYIKGGAYGDTLTSIGKGSGAKNLTGLQPNTTYKVITRATNGITESYSAYETFTTLGNPPTITDVYASSTSLTGATITHEATYDHNAKFSQYKIQWRYPGSTTWTDISISNNKITNTNFDDKNDNRIEYRITVTDNWNRSTTSSVLSYRVMFDYSNDITNFKAVRNSDDTFTITGNWTKRLYTKIQTCLILGLQSQKQYEVAGDLSNLTLSQTGFSFKTKQYKNKYIGISFNLAIKTKLGNEILKYISVKENNYPNAINTISSKSGVLSKELYSIVNIEGRRIEKKLLRHHDIIKLSRKIRYIDIDSRGTSSNINTKNTIVHNLGVFTFDISYTMTHISKTLYLFSIDDLRIKTNINNIKVRIRNNSLSLMLNNGDNRSYISEFVIPNMTVDNTYKTIDTSYFNTYVLQQNNNSTQIKSNITFLWYPEFDNSTQQSNTILYSKNVNYGNSDIMNNHLVNIKVFDDLGVDRAAGNPIKLADGSNPIIYNGGNATVGIIDSNKFIYSENGLPLRLDLGAEYKISRIEIQRRILTDNTYIRNYIIGRNKDKELCYIFYDSFVNKEYIETNKTINIK